VSAEANKATVRNYIEEVLNRRNLDAIEKYLAPNFVDHDANNPPGTAEVRKLLTTFLGAFPDLRVTVDAAVAEGDMVACRYTITGTHLGDLFGIPPTNKRATWKEFDMTRFDENGIMVERWACEDQMAQQEQLGLLKH
jgi:predicted ester cyclase